MDYFDEWDIGIEPARKKTADHPHWWTIGLGLLAPTIGCVALFVSLRSLNVSRTSMEIGQRAYIGLRNMTAKEEGHYIHLIYELRNLGNTPARKVNIGYKFESNLERLDGPMVIEVPWRWQVVRIGSNTDLGPKEDIKVDELQDYQHLGYPSELNKKLTNIEVHVKYDDVFDNTHLTYWCWQMTDTKPLSACMPLQTDQK